MASKDTVSLYFTIDDSQDGLKKLTLDADGLRKVMTENVKITQKLQDSIFSTSAMVSTISALSRTIPYSLTL